MVDQKDEIIEVGGVKSSKLDERFDLVPFAGIRDAARRFALGAKKYAPRMWERGNADLAEDRMNHMVRHCLLFSQYRRQEDLDAFLCNGMMMSFFKDKGFLPEKGEDGNTNSR